MEYLCSWILVVCVHLQITATGQSLSLIIKTLWNMNWAGPLTDCGLGKKMAANASVLLRKARSSWQPFMCPNESNAYLIHSFAHFSCMAFFVEYLWFLFICKLQLGGLSPSLISTTQSNLNCMWRTVGNHNDIDILPGKNRWIFDHDDVMKWKHFPRYWLFVRGIHRSPVNSPHKGQWRWALMFSMICAWINGWVNIREAGDLRRHRAEQYDVIVMGRIIDKTSCCSIWSGEYSGEFPLQIASDSEFWYFYLPNF